LTRFYGLTGYLSPPIYPSFTAVLCQNLSSSTDSIHLANLINSAEPLVAKQRITQTLLGEWKRKLDEEALELTQQGEGFGRTDDPAEFDEWHSTSKKFLVVVKEFVRWGTVE